MKKRIILLALAFVMVLALAAPAMALEMGDKLTKEDVQTALDDGTLKPMWVDGLGAWLGGEWLQSDGSSAKNEVYFGSGKKLFVDEDGTGYVLQAVMDASGSKILQVMGIIPNAASNTYLTSKPPVVTNGGKIAELDYYWGY